MRSGRYFIHYKNGLRVVKDNQEITLDEKTGCAVLEMQDFDFINQKDITYLSTSVYQKADFFRLSDSNVEASTVVQDTKIVRVPWCYPVEPVSRLFTCNNTLEDGFGNFLGRCGTWQFENDYASLINLGDTIFVGVPQKNYKLTAEISISGSGALLSFDGENSLWISSTILCTYPSNSITTVQAGWNTITIQRIANVTTVKYNNYIVDTKYMNHKFLQFGINVDTVPHPTGRKNIKNIKLEY